MIEETIYSSEKNNFMDNTFSSQEWSAPTMVSPEEIKELIASFNLEGRIIRCMRMIGHAYNLTRDWVEERAYNYFTHTRSICLRILMAIKMDESTTRMIVLRLHRRRGRRNPDKSPSRRS